MDEVKLALEMNKLVHNECKDVPHDIGLRLLEVIKKHIGEQLNLPPVIKSVCDDCTAYPFDERGTTPLCKTCKDNPSQTVL